MKKDKIQPSEIKCKGPAISKSRQCIALRKKMNKKQADRITNLIDIMTNRKINESAEAKPGGEKVGVAGSGEAKTGLDIAGVAGSSRGRLAVGYNAPNSQYLAKDPRTGKVNTSRVNGLDTGTSAFTLSDIAQRMEREGKDSTDSREVWRFTNGEASSNLLNSALLALRNPELLTDPDAVQQWRNGDNSWLDRVGGNVYFRDDLAESPDDIMWWANNWKQRALTEEEGAAAAAPTNSMGGNFSDGQVGETVSAIAGLDMPLGASRPTARPGSARRYRERNRKKQKKLSRGV